MEFAEFLEFESLGMFSGKVLDPHFNISPAIQNKISKFIIKQNFDEKKCLRIPRSFKNKMMHSFSLKHAMFFYLFDESKIKKGVS